MNPCQKSGAALLSVSSPYALNSANKHVAFKIITFHWVIFLIIRKILLSGLFAFPERGQS